MTLYFAPQLGQLNRTGDALDMVAVEEKPRLMLGSAAGLVNWRLPSPDKVAIKAE
jgi:hypothetical protein